MHNKGEFSNEGYGLRISGISEEVVQGTERIHRYIGYRGRDL
jgi:hypothetical protein